MEPLNDRDLDDLLAAWRAPSMPPEVDRRIMHQRRGAWMSWLLKGRIVLPVPVLALVTLGILVLAAVTVRVPRTNESPAARSQGLQPVKHLNIRIIRSGYEIHN